MRRLYGALLLVFASCSPSNEKQPQPLPKVEPPPESVVLEGEKVLPQDFPLPKGCRAAFLAHEDTLVFVAYSPDGKSLATWTEHPKSLGQGRLFPAVKLWDPISAKKIHSLNENGRVLSAAFSPDGKTLATGGQTWSFQGRLRYWDVDTGKEKGAPQEHGRFVTNVTFSGDGKLLAMVSSDKSWDRKITLFEVDTGKVKATRLECGENRNSAAFSGNLLAYATVDREPLSRPEETRKTIHLWDVAADRVVAHLKDPARAVTFSPDGKNLASWSYGDTVKLWDVVTGKPLATLQGSGAKVTCAAFSPDGKWLATGSVDKTIKLWDVDSTKEKAQLQCQPDEVWSVAFSKDGKTLASGGNTGMVLLWDVPELKQADK